MQAALTPFFLGGFDDLVTAFQGHVQGLFNDDMLACLDGGQRRFHVGAGRCADGHHVYIRVIQHGLQVAIADPALGFGECLGPFRGHVIGADQVCAVHMVDGLGVKGADQCLFR